MPALPRRTLEHHIDSYRAAVAYYGSVRKASAALGVSKSALHRWTTGEVNIHTDRTSRFIRAHVRPQIMAMTREERQALKRATVLIEHKPARVSEWKSKSKEARDDDIEAWADVVDEWVESEFGYA